MKKILICGAGGFIGGHLANYFSKDENIKLICVDIKSKDFWFQKFDTAKNFSLDLKDLKTSICDNVSQESRLRERARASAVGVVLDVVSDCAGVGWVCVEGCAG